MQVGFRQLGSDHLGHGAAHHEEPERGHHVRDTDLLVVGRREEPEDAAGPALGSTFVHGALVHQGHGEPPFASQASNSSGETARTVNVMR